MNEFIVLAVERHQKHALTRIPGRGWNLADASETRVSVTLARQIRSRNVHGTKFFFFLLLFFSLFPPLYESYI